MIKNFSYTIPTVGRISIGEKVVHNGTYLPLRLNHFMITSQHKREGKWVEHPITNAVVKSTGQSKEKITEIPVCLMFNDPDLSIRERYEAFDDKGRMLCAGDGERARRLVAGKIEVVDCPGKDQCQFARMARCKLMTRLNVQINVEPENQQGKPVTSDPLSSFILRSTGVNTARTLHSKLKYLHAILGEKLIGVPFTLKLRQKSSVQSHQSIFFYADLVPACSLVDAAKFAKEAAQQMADAGLNQEAFEAAVRAGLDNGPFEDTLEDFAEYEDYLEDGFQQSVSAPKNDSAHFSASAEDGAVTNKEEGSSDENLTGLDALRALVAKKAA